MKKYFRKEKPSNDQIIGFKATRAHYPEIGAFQTFDNGIEEVYIPANDDVEQLIILREKTKSSSSSKQIKLALKQLHLIKTQILTHYFAEIPAHYYDLYKQNSFRKSGVVQSPHFFLKVCFIIRYGRFFSFATF